jgi:MFS family permease
MSIWTSHPDAVPLSGAYASYFISYICLGTAPLIFAWLSDLIPQDPEARTLIVGVSVAGYYAISAWSQVLVWPASQAPYYKYGWQSALALLVLVILMTCLLRIIDVRYLLPKRAAFFDTLEGQVVVHDSVSGPSTGDREQAQLSETDRKTAKTTTLAES